MGETTTTNASVRPPYQPCQHFALIFQNDCDIIDLIRWVFEIVIPIIILVFGLVSNTTISIIVTRNRFSNRGSHYCLFIIAMTDSVWLVVNYMHFYVRKWGETYGVNIFYCKITGVLSYAATGCSYWLTTAMVTMRFCSVCRPIQTRRITTVKNIKILTLAVAAVTLAAHTPFFITEEIDADSICYDQDSWFSTMISSIHFGVFMALPFSWLIVVNTILSIKLHLRRRRSFRRGRERDEELANGSQDSAPSVPDQRCPLRQVSGGEGHASLRLTIMLVITSWLYAVLTLPWYVQDIYYGVYSNVDKSDRYRAAINSITWTLGMLNYADNGIVYCTMFADFRRQVSKLISGRSIESGSGDKSTNDQPPTAQ